ncbi:MAG: hypothetical protein JWO98_2065 [Frankiales bacterium]|nr:hypothetical protein [Frankiales bacterium]
MSELQRRTDAELEWRRSRLAEGQARRDRRERRRMVVATVAGGVLIAVSCGLSLAGAATASLIVGLAVALPAAGGAMWMVVSYEPPPYERPEPADDAPRWAPLPSNSPVYGGGAAPGGSRSSWGAAWRDQPQITGGWPALPPAGPAPRQITP